MFVLANKGAGLADVVGFYGWILSSSEAEGGES